MQARLFYNRSLMHACMHTRAHCQYPCNDDNFTHVFESCNITPLPLYRVAQHVTSSYFIRTVGQPPVINEMLKRINFIGIPLTHFLPQDGVRKGGILRQRKKTATWPLESRQRKADAVYRDDPQISRTSADWRKHQTSSIHDSGRVCFAASTHTGQDTVYS